MVHAVAMSNPDPGSPFIWLRVCDWIKDRVTPADVLRLDLLEEIPAEHCLQFFNGSPNLRGVLLGDGLLIRDRVIQC